MRKSKIPVVLLLLAVLFLLATRLVVEATAQQQTAPRKYLIKPLNLGTNTEIRARSTRNLQVQVTDENDRPVSDVPLLFLLSGAGSGTSAAGTLAASSVTGTIAGQAAGTVAGQAASSAVGSVAGGGAGTAVGQAASGGAQGLAGQTSLRAVTNQYGIANANFTAADSVGSSLRLQVRVEGTDVMWEGTLDVVRADAVAEPAPDSAPVGDAASLPALEAEDKACVALINQFRAEYQQPPVKVSVKLTKAAQWLSQDNADNKPTAPSHTDSLKRSVGQRLIDFGYEAEIIKENIVVGAESAAQAMQVWLASGFHIRNLLNGEVKVVGVSRICKKGAKLNCHWTVILGSTPDQIIP